MTKITLDTIKVFGNTYPHKDYLKQMGFTYVPKNVGGGIAKAFWYRTYENYTEDDVIRVLGLVNEAVEYDVRVNVDVHHYEEV